MPTRCAQARGSVRPSSNSQDSVKSLFDRNRSVEVAEQENSFIFSFIFQRDKLGDEKKRETGDNRRVECNIYYDNKKEVEKITLIWIVRNC